MSAPKIALTALACAALGFAGGLRWRKPAPPPSAPPPASATPDRESTIRQFHEVYYGAFDQTWHKTFWMGVPTLKCPLDLFVFQEILYENRPDWVIEAGTYKGGSAFYMATLMDALGSGRVVTIDITDQPGKPRHERITYLLGSSTSPEIVASVRSRIGKKDKVMVVLDSDHSAKHVLDELRLYSPLVTPGQYLVVEDTNVNGHPVMPAFGPGPMEALDTFLGENSGFEIDTTREKFLLTFNPRGYLRKIH
jgi:cephalosporin hydroxylase